MCRFRGIWGRWLPVSSNPSLPVPSLSQRAGLAWRRLRRTATSRCSADGTGLAEYRATPRNLGALIAVRDLDDERAEVITLSRWPSMDAIRGFAGDDVERAVYYPQGDRYLLTKPEKVQHYQSHGAFDPPTHG
jgi:hypothetical protein